MYGCLAVRQPNLAILAKPQRSPVEQPWQPVEQPWQPVQEQQPAPQPRLLLSKRLYRSSPV